MYYVDTSKYVAIILCFLQSEHLAIHNTIKELLVISGCELLSETRRELLRDKIKSSLDASHE